MNKLAKNLFLLFIVVLSTIILKGNVAHASDSFNYSNANGWWAINSGYNVNNVTGRVVAGDFNGDGKKDIATFYDYGNTGSRIHVFTSTGSSFTYSGPSGWWGVSSGYNTAKIVSVVAGDFNGDGKDDIAVVYDYGNSSTRIHVFISTGNSFSYTNANGWWGVSSGYDANKIAGVVAGDFNGDGKDDIAIMYDYGNTASRIHVFTSTGSSFTYSGPSGWWSVPSGYDVSKIKGRMVAGDFNGDGKDDIATMYDYGNGASRIHVFTSTGSSFTYSGPSGWWQVPYGYDSNKVTGRMVAGDFNGDGKADIAAMYDYGNTASRIHVFTSTGSSFSYTNANGWWGVTSGYDANKVTNRFVAGDFNGDGKADIAAFYDYGNTASRIHVWLAAGSNYLTKTQVQNLFTNIKVTDSMVSNLNSTLEKYNINTLPRMRHFISQCMEESGLGLYTVEQGSDEYLNNNYGPGTSAGRNLGNTQSGDGARFRGIGYIQVTGRYNYQNYSNYKSDSNIMIGYSYTINKYNPWDLSGFWWYHNGLNSLVDSGATVEQVTLRVNGGYNGLSLRKKYYNQCCNVII